MGTSFPLLLLEFFRKLISQIEQHAWVAFTIVAAVNSLCFAIFHQLTLCVGWSIPQHDLNVRAKAILCDKLLTGSMGVSCNIALSHWMHHSLSKFSITVLTIAWISLRLVLLGKNEQSALSPDPKEDANIPPQDAPLQIHLAPLQEEALITPEQQEDIPLTSPQEDEVIPKALHGLLEDALPKD